MAKITAPLLSFGARGSIAKTAVYSAWRGVNYARQHVIPANPQTTAQQTVRKTFALLREMYKIAPPILSAPWVAFATGRPFTGMNAYIGENVRVLNGQTDMSNWIGSPGALGGPPPLSVAGAPGTSGEITVTITPPTQIPEGWVIEAAQAAAFNQQAPDDFFTGPLVAGEDMSAPYSISLTGLGAGEVCVMAGWLKWTRPDNKSAYSVGITSVVTAGA